jgi:putative restriction endonuclease
LSRYSLSVDNGLLLSALWDAAFDKGLVAFDDDGTALVAARVAGATMRALRQVERLALPMLTAPLQARLARHRALHSGCDFRRIT